MPVLLKAALMAVAVRGWYQASWLSIPRCLAVMQLHTRLLLVHRFMVFVVALFYEVGYRLRRRLTNGITRSVGASDAADVLVTRGLIQAAHRRSHQSSF